MSRRETHCISARVGETSLKNQSATRFGRMVQHRASRLGKERGFILRFLLFSPSDSATRVCAFFFSSSLFCATHSLKLHSSNQAQ